MNPILKRILADALLVAFALFLPWFATLALGSLFFFFFDSFFELIVAGFLMDLLFGVPLLRFGGFQFVLSLGALLLTLVLYPLRARMRI